MVKRFFYLNLIKSKFFFMTLTDLGNHEIRKTKISTNISIFFIPRTVFTEHIPQLLSTTMILSFAQDPNMKLKLKN